MDIRNSYRCKLSGSSRSAQWCFRPARSDGRKPLYSQYGHRRSNIRTSCICSYRLSDRSRHQGRRQAISSGTQPSESYSRIRSSLWTGNQPFSAPEETILHIRNSQYRQTWSGCIRRWYCKTNRQIAREHRCFIEGWRCYDERYPILYHLPARHLRLLYRRATDESVLSSDTAYHRRGKSMQTRLADRNGMHCRKTRTEINADKCRKRP